MAVDRLEGGERRQSFAEPSQTHVEATLTRLAQDYDLGGYIADEVLPPVPVDSIKYQYPVWDDKPLDTESSSTDPGIKRADKAPWARSERTVTWTEAETEEYGLEVPISDRERTKGPNLDLDGVNTNFATSVVRNEQEARVADLLTTTGNMATGHYTTLSSSADQWDSYSEADSDPIEDIDTGRQTIHGASGKNPNLLVLGRQVFDKLKWHPSLTDVFKYSERGIVTAEMMAAALGIDKVLIGDAIYNTAAEGQTKSGSYIWGKHAVLLYQPPSPVPNTMSAGWQFQYRGIETKKWREEKISCDVVRVSHDQDEELTNTACIYLIASAVA